MDVLGTKEIQRLTQASRGPCVSIYMPTHVSGEQAQEDVIRLKNLLNQAQEQLVDQGTRAPEAHSLLDAASQLPNDPVFWRDRSHGLAIFASPEMSEHYRVPRAFKESMRVGKRFHTTPLLPIVLGNDRFLTLTLSENQVRLFKGSRFSFEELENVDLPQPMSKALNVSHTDGDSQVHSAMRGSLGKQAAVFHGQGGESSSHKNDLAQYFRLIDGALQPILSEEQVPLLLGGVQHLIPIYRQISGYALLQDQAIIGNFDRASPADIHKEAWSVMESVLRDDQASAAEKYARLAGTGKASDDMSQILAAAADGNIESLFVDVNAVQWGRFDAAKSKVEVHERFDRGDDDLLDVAAAKTMACGGTIFAVEQPQMPSPRSAAAVFRY